MTNTTVKPTNAETPSAPSPNNAPRKDAYDFGKAVAAQLEQREMPHEKIMKVIGPMIETARRYAEQRQELRRVYVRITKTAERAIANLDAGFAPYVHDDLGSDRDRLVALHQQIATLNETLFGVRSTLEALDIDIDPFDYLNV